MKRKGFTMVELLSVIAILAIIMLIAVPIFGGIADQTNQSVYESKIANVKAAAEAYAEESGRTVFDIKTLIEAGKIEADNESGEYRNPVNKLDMKCYVINVRYENLHYYANVHETSECYSNDKLEEMYGAFKIIAYTDENKSDTLVPVSDIWYNTPVYIGYSLTNSDDADLTVAKVVWQGDRSFSCSKDEGNLNDCDFYGGAAFGTSDGISNMKVGLEVTFRNEAGAEFISKISKVIAVDMEGPRVESIVSSLGSADQSGKRVDIEMSDGNGSGLLEYKMVKVESASSPLPICANESGYKPVTQSKMVEYQDNGIYYTCVRDKVGNDNQSTLASSKIEVTGVDYSHVNGKSFKLVSSGESTPLKAKATIVLNGSEDTSKLKMCVSNTGFLKGCNFETYKSNFDWTITGNADCNNRTVYLSISDAAGNVTNLVSSPYSPVDTVKYDANGGSLVTASDSKKTACYNGTYPLPSVKRTGYTFDGWYTEKTGGTKITSTSKVNFNGLKTLYAHWTVNNYYIDLNGILDGTSSGNTNGYGTFDVYINGSKVSTGVTDYYAQHPYGTKYEFKNIKATTGHTYNGVSSGSASSTLGAGNASVQLKFTTNNYTVTWNGNGGTVTKNGATSVKYNNNVGTLGTATRTGYTFAGWYTAASGGTQISTTTKVTGAVTYYAHWTVNKYYLDLNGLLDGGANGGIAGFGTADVYINGSKVATGVSDYYTQWNYGTKYEIKNIKATTGHTYNGVSSGSVSGTIGAGNVTVQLKFTTNSYSVSWNGNGGTVTKNGATSVKYNNNVGTLGTATRSGYTFLGWFTDASGGSQISTGTKVTGNVTYYAHWKQDFPSSHCILGAGYITKVGYKDEQNFRVYFSDDSHVEDDARLYHFHTYTSYKRNGDIDMGTNSRYQIAYDSPSNYAEYSDSVVEHPRYYQGNVYYTTAYRLYAGSWYREYGYLNWKITPGTLFYGATILDEAELVLDSDSSNYGGLDQNKYYGYLRKHYLTDKKIKIKCNHGTKEFTMTYVN